jgi:hypothetical protein
LTEPRTAGQSRIVMAALLSDGDAQRENERDERDAQGWETVGGDGAVPSQAEIRSQCAFTCMNAVSRKNLTDARAVDANDVDTASETGGAFGDGRDRARFCRTTATRPRCLAHHRDGRAPSVTGGTKRRPLHCGEVAHSQGHRPIDLSQPRSRRREFQQRAARPEGEHSSRVCVPPCFSSIEVQPAATRGDGMRVCGGEWDCGYERPCEPLRGSILTRVPPSSIDRSAPSSMSSRCTSRA